MHCNAILLTRPLRNASVVLAMLAAAVTAQADEVPEPALTLDAAMAAYEINHWSEAFTSLAQFADRGDAKAARIALQMWRYGPKLYQSNFPASAAQIERWTQLWSCQAAANSSPCWQARQVVQTR